MSGIFTLKLSLLLDLELVVTMERISHAHDMSFNNEK